MNCIILGNGFDLNHGLETTFNDYRIFLDLFLANPFDKSFRNNIHKHMNKYGNTKDDVIKMVKFVNDVTKSKPDKKQNEMYNWNNFESDLFDYCEIKSYEYRSSNSVSWHVGFGKGLYLPLEKTTFDYINQNLECFSICLQAYLDYIKEDIELNDQFKEIFDKADLIITLNYTHTYKPYITENRFVKVVHIHGDKESLASLIVGFQNKELKESIKGDSIEGHLNSSGYFLKNNLSFDRDGRTLLHRIIEIEEQFAKKIDKIDIIGWSCSTIDKHIIELILSLIKIPEGPEFRPRENKNFKKNEINIFTHPKINEYSELRERFSGMINESKNYDRSMRILGGYQKNIMSNFIEVDEVEYIIRENEDLIDPVSDKQYGDEQISAL